MRKLKWPMIGVSTATLATVLVLIQTASAGDLVYPAIDGAHLTGGQAASRLTSAVSDVWTGSLITLDKIDCAKQNTDPVVWHCDHAGTGQAELSVVLAAMAAAADNPLRRIKIRRRVPGTSQVAYSQWIRGVYTPAQMATRYSAAIAGIWRASISGVTSLMMRKTEDAPPYLLQVRGAVTSTQAAYLDALEAAQDDELHELGQPVEIE